MTTKQPTIAIVGAGIGGLTAAILLERAGFNVQVYEQAKAFARVGAGIQMGPNAMQVLRHMGLEEHLRSFAFEPSEMVSREWNTGEITNRHPLNPQSHERYGTPYLLLHRGDLHAALARTFDSSRVHLGREVTDLSQDGNGAQLAFADGSHADADAVIGADGIHSTVRTLLFGAESPRYIGRVAYRTTFPAALLNGYEIDDNTKWWGPDRHIVIYYITKNRDEVYFVTSVPEERHQKESWSQEGDLNVLREAFEGFHPQVREVLKACPKVHKWGIFVRDPMPSWQAGRVVLLGDACHPMTPYMAQGAATSMEDAAVLARCLTDSRGTSLEEAFACYESARKERTSAIQQLSARNTWMQRGTDADWVYGYDAVRTPVEQLERPKQAWALNS